MVLDSDPNGDYAALNASLAATEQPQMSLAAGNYSPASITYIDKSSEKSTLQMYGVLLTAANFDAQRTLWATLLAKIDILALGNKTRSVYGIESIYVETIPSSNLAQRENKLLVLYQDVTTGQKLTMTIPTIDLEALSFLTGAGDNVAIDTPTAVDEFVTAMNAFARNPATGNITAVYGLKFVGRNS